MVTFSTTKYFYESLDSGSPRWEKEKSEPHIDTCSTDLTFIILTVSNTRETLISKLHTVLKIIIRNEYSLELPLKNINHGMLKFSEYSGTVLKVFIAIIKVFIALSHNRVRSIHCNSGNVYRFSRANVQFQNE